VTIFSDQFPTETAGLPTARPAEWLELADGDVLDLRIGPVAKQLGDTTVRMLAYDGSIPGPVLHVRQHSTLVVNVTNDGDHEGTVHWHGLCLDNRFDGTHETQAPIPVGGRFTYRIEFPDPGVYWYHPHIREDYGQEMGLYGNIVVAPADPEYWPCAHRELALMLDDVLIEDGRIAPFSRTETNYVAMGRFGNVLLVNGDPELSLGAKQGEVVRMYLTNTANTRVFNVGIPGARMKRVGGDSGHYEREEFVDGLILAPSERVVVDVCFDETGELTLEHRTPDRTYPLAMIRVADEQVEPSLKTEFEQLRTSDDMRSERARIGVHLEAEPDKTVAFVAEMDMGEPELPPGATLAYTCPMHPEVISDEAGRCPRCGMALLATASVPIAYACPMHPEARADQAERCPECGMKLVPAQLVQQPATGGGHDEHAHHHGDAAGGIEWEDDMVDVNRITTPANTRWKLIDRTTGAEGAGIDWRFRVGDRVKIRLVNEMDSDHPMHHPFHIHGAGRFLILSRDGTPEPNLVWKDTVLVPAGQVVDLLLDVTNPGRWMAHCHIAEHHESGMMFSFTVDP
jgi:FtsP/CotA-like multicopper oxidase with cupredoxin domain